ncbi:NK-tumor recognition protein-like [Ctenocephalides felis]|uniref:NK-tumor recognition protein-like n=1 Tax=Ctenocephalides felis TaxID=7515 RepID=UPI000E6E469A|nr:NK-tumor recognition protein-like [Ctenocephalides felis]
MRYILCGRRKPMVTNQLAPRRKHRKGKHPKKECLRVRMPGCKALSKRKNCERKIIRKKCTRVVPPYPSFTECLKEPSPKHVETECDCNELDYLQPHYSIFKPALPRYDLPEFLLQPPEGIYKREKKPHKIYHCGSKEQSPTACGRGKKKSDMVSGAWRRIHYPLGEKTQEELKRENLSRPDCVPCPNKNNEKHDSQPLDKYSRFSAPPEGENKSNKKCVKPTLSGTSTKSYHNAANTSDKTHWLPKKSCKKSTDSIKKSKSKSITSGSNKSKKCCKSTKISKVRSKSKSEESKTSHCELRKLECQKSSVDITKNTDPEYLEFDQHWKQSNRYSQSGDKNLTRSKSSGSNKKCEMSSKPLRSRSSQSRLTYDGSDALRKSSSGTLSQRSSNASVSSKTSSKSVTKSCSSGPVVTRKAGQSTRRMAGNPCKADLKNCASECGKLDLKKKVKKKVDYTSKSSSTSLLSAKSSKTLSASSKESLNKCVSGQSVRRMPGNKCKADLRNCASECDQKRSKITKPIKVEKEENKCARFEEWKKTCKENERDKSPKSLNSKDSLKSTSSTSITRSPLPDRKASIEMGSGKGKRKHRERIERSNSGGSVGTSSSGPNTVNNKGKQVEVEKVISDKLATNPGGKVSLAAFNQKHNLPPIPNFPITSRKRPCFKPQHYPRTNKPYRFCERIRSPGCPRRLRIMCIKKNIVRKCKRPFSPRPSFSECMRPAWPKFVRNECKIAEMNLMYPKKIIYPHMQENENECIPRDKLLKDYREELARKWKQDVGDSPDPEIEKTWPIPRAMLLPAPPYQAQN